VFVTRQYEVVYIFDSALEEPAVTERLGRFHALLGPETEVSVNHWGKRTLAYPIKRKDTGYYAIVRFAATAEVLPEFERALKLDESLLRFLIVIAETEQPTVRVPLETGVAAEEEDE
jgi:small subunit ribosomal protein S6